MNAPPEVTKENVARLLPMTDEQENDLRAIKDRFRRLVDKKYRAGAAEHGGNIWDNVTLEELEDELIDAFCYLQAWKRKFNFVKLQMEQRIAYLQGVADGKEE